MSGLVHLHARTGTGAGCRCECGVPCGDRTTTAYRGLDPERVTCPDCLRIFGGSEPRPPHH